MKQLHSLNAQSSTLKAPQKSWTERLVDFLLGPAPHPIYMAGAAAGFGGPGRSPDARRSDGHRRDGGDTQSAQIALALAGLSSCAATDSTQRDESGRR